MQHHLQLPTESFYFFSDSNDLVRYVSQEMQHQEIFSTRHAIRSKQKRTIVARTSKDADGTIIYSENVHIDKQKGRIPSSYYGTFLDLFLAINARCIVYGVGYYAYFAAKISGTTCTMLYQEEVWGQYNTTKSNKHTQVCHL